MNDQRTQPAILRVGEPYQCGADEVVTPIVIDYLGFEFECRAFIDSVSKVRQYAQNIVNCINECQKAKT